MTLTERSFALENHSLQVSGSRPFRTSRQTASRTVVEAKRREARDRQWAKIGRYVVEGRKRICRALSQRVMSKIQASTPLAPSCAITAHSLKSTGSVYSRVWTHAEVVHCYDHILARRVGETTTQPHRARSYPLKGRLQSLDALRVLLLFISAELTCSETPIHTRLPM